MVLEVREFDTTRRPAGGKSGVILSHGEIGFCRASNLPCKDWWTCFLESCLLYPRHLTDEGIIQVRVQAVSRGRVKPAGRLFIR
jgi:hypothetical protein